MKQGCRQTSDLLFLENEPGIVLFPSLFMGADSMLLKQL